MKSEAKSKKYDVVIVGSGVAGSLVAHSLVQRGISCLMLEAGARLDRGQLLDRFQNAAVKDTMAPYPSLKHAPHPIPSRPDDYLIQKGPDRYDSQYIRAVGGTTWHWAAAAWRLLPNDFRLKSTYGVGRDWGLAYDTLEPYYGKAEGTLGVSGDKNEDLGSPRSHPYPMGPIPLSYMDSTFSRELNRVGYKVVTEPVARNSQPFDGRPQCCGNNNCMPICPIGAQYSGDVHARKAEGAGTKLVPNAVADFIEVDALGKVSRVRYRDPSGTAQWAVGRYFVLAANGIETPKLLLLSRSVRTPKGVANSSDQVGRNLMDHPGTAMTFLVPKPLYPGRGPQEMTSIVNLRDGAFRKEFSAKKIHLSNQVDTNGITKELLAKNLYGKALDQKIKQLSLRRLRLDAFHEILPDPENRIVPSESLSDGLGIPRPEIHYRIGDYVRKSAQDTRSHFAKIAAAMGGEEAQFLDDFAPNSHLMGTTIMGTIGKDSVVNTDCQTHDHSNLFIASSAVFASAACVNPTLTIAALSLRLADHLHRKLKSKVSVGA